MYIQFDANKLHVQVICGTMEKYEPSDKIKEVQEKVNLLRGKVEEFMANTMKSSIEEITKLVDEENSKFVEKTKEETK